jgi:hypothetical protein
MLAAPKVVGSLCLVFCSLALSAQTGFGNLRVGQSVTAIPFPCTDVVSCEGEYESSWVRVSFNNGTISNIHVIYSGKTQLGDPIEMTPITLAQSVKVHSLQDGMKSPVFGMAQRRDGTVFGVVDTENQIVYITNSTEQSGTVSEVVYVRPDAPVLASATRAKLADGGESLVQSARAAGPYTNTAKKPHLRGIDASMSSKDRTRIDTPQDLRVLDDKDKGGGKKTAPVHSSGMAPAARKRQRQP